MNWKLFFTKAKIYFRFIPWIALLLLILYTRECTTSNRKIAKAKPVQSDSISLKPDTLKLKGDTIYYPVPYAVIDTLEIHLERLDSARIISEFMRLNKYDILALDDTNGKVNLFADVQFNKIQRVSYTASFYPKIKTVFVPEKPRMKLFAGFKTGICLQDTGLILAPTLSLLTKKDHLYSVSYEPFRRIAEVGFEWKIRFRKPP